MNRNIVYIHKSNRETTLVKYLDNLKQNGSNKKITKIVYLKELSRMCKILKNREKRFELLMNEKMKGNDENGKILYYNRNTLC